MGRALQPGTIRSAKPSGPRWTEFRKWLFSEPFAAKNCYHCGHAIRLPGWQFGEVQHLVSPEVRPDLAWAVPNLVPVHAGDYSRTGGPNKRCPDCGLACQAVAASNVAPRDEEGRPLPWDAAFIRAAQQRSGRAHPGGQVPGNPRKPARETGEVPETPARSRPVTRAALDVGRDW